MNEVKYMPDYKKMYPEMAREAEKAIQILIDAQQKCEEMYINTSEIPIALLKKEDDTKKLCKRIIKKP